MQIISNEILTRSLDRKALVEALQTGFRRGATVPSRHHHTIEREDTDATLLLMPAWSNQGKTEGQIGIKQVTVFPSNANKSLPSIYGIYTLLDGATGAPLVVMDGRILTLYRTAATSVMAASYLARADASRLLMVGTGALAPHIISTYAEVLDIKEVKIWGRSYEKASSIANELSLSGQLPQHVSICATSTIQDAAGWADIISCATLSKTPLIHGEWVSAGTFIDLIGGYTPQMREADDDLIQRASLFVDTRNGALTEAGDIMIPIQSGLINSEDIMADLFDLTKGRHTGRRSNEEITCFKSIGYALEDLVTAQLVYSTLNL